MLKSNEDQQNSIELKFNLTVTALRSDCWKQGFLVFLADDVIACENGVFLILYWLLNHVCVCVFPGCNEQDTHHQCSLRSNEGLSALLGPEGPRP